MKRGGRLGREYENLEKFEERYEYLFDGARIRIRWRLYLLSILKKNTYRTLIFFINSYNNFKTETKKAKILHFICFQTKEYQMIGYLLLLAPLLQAEPTKDEWLSETEYTKRRMVRPEGVFSIDGGLQAYTAEGLDGLATVGSIGVQYGMGKNYSILIDTGVRLTVPSNMYGESGWTESAVIGGFYQLEESETRQIALGVGIPLDFGGGELLSSVGFSGILRMPLQEKLFLEVGQNILSINLDPFILSSSPAAALQYQIDSTTYASVSIPLYSLYIGENVPDPSIWLLGGDKRINLKYGKYYSKALTGEVRVGLADFTNPGLTATITAIAHYRM